MYRFRRQVCEFHRAIGLSRSKHIQGRVDRRPPQVTLLVLQHFSMLAPAEHAQKHGLRNIFGIRGVARDPVRRAEDQAVISLKYPIEFARDCDGPFLCQCGLQGTPPVAFFHN